ncbi:Solvent efflux pump outer membrane protein SrpC [Thalassocella blandensis]|nr:Solvent efflux pump outer membrane protein SrpC [Thalassocella blandensis]
MKFFPQNTQRSARMFSRTIAVFTIPVLLASGCSVGPDYVKPTVNDFEEWKSWSNSEERSQVSFTQQMLPPNWWFAFQDPVLNELQHAAFSSSLDLKTAQLRFAQVRVQRQTVAAQRGPSLDVNAGASRQRQSEYGVGTRVTDVMGGDRGAVVDKLSEPFTSYQAGFDASWELDLWGRVRRSIEAADADVQQQQALLDLAKLVLVSDIARNYFDLRTVQDLIQLTREDIAALSEQVDLLKVRVDNGLVDHFDLERQRSELISMKSNLPPLLAQERMAENRITLLLGKMPGSLQALLKPVTPENDLALPDLELGLPSELALRRPDIRAAEARLHQATANIGVARADLYPSFRLGARFGYESYLSEEFLNWGSRAWSVSPMINLPLFDRGRRKSVVQLRELQQQEAAISYEQTLLKAWQEIDDALSTYAAEWEQMEQLKLRVQSAHDVFDMAEAKYSAGLANLTALLDTQRSYLQARRDLINSEGRLYVQFVAINKAIGNVPLQVNEQAPNDVSLDKNRDDVNLSSINP